jgi:hypothetical protein
VASYQDDTESRFSWARQLIADAEKPVTIPAIPVRPARREVSASRGHDGSFGRDRNIIQARRGDDGMAIYQLRESVGW